jgi:hypothetical protein
LLDAADVIIKSISDLPGIIERSRSIERDEFIPA